MSTDLSSIILNSGLSVSEMADLITKVSNAGTDAAGSSEFKEALNEATSQITQLNSENSKISEAQELIAALDKSILGTVASSVDMSELSEDLLKSSGKENVVEQLMQGHMQSIVTTKSDDEDEGADIAKTVTGSMNLNEDNEEPAHSVEESLEEIVARLGAVVASV